MAPEPIRPAQARKLVSRLRGELEKHLDVDTAIAAFGQVDAVRRREAGELFPLRDHLRGMVLSMLSANRPWRGIADHLDQLHEIFGDFRPSFVERARPATLEAAVSRLRCGNPRIRPQLVALRPNLDTFRRIEDEFGSVDHFVADRPVETVVHDLVRGRRFKLREIGPALALEYLKNVGVRVSKPDPHLLRICGPDHLALVPPDASAQDAFDAFLRFARAAKVQALELENLVRLLDTTNYAAARE